jgi:hypothetical protein
MGNKRVLSEVMKVFLNKIVQLSDSTRQFARERATCTSFKVWRTTSRPGHSRTRCILAEKPTKMSDGWLSWLTDEPVAACILSASAAVAASRVRFLSTAAAAAPYKIRHRFLPITKDQELGFCRYGFERMTTPVLPAGTEADHTD